MTNYYISVQHQAAGWYWRIECVEGFYPWNGPFADEKTALRNGRRFLRKHTLKLRPEVVEALREWNLRVNGRGYTGEDLIVDPEAIARLQSLAFTGEDLNDTILRMFCGGPAKLH